jgi:hypothetical protein
MLINLRVMRDSGIQERLMNIAAINEACVASRNRRVATACGAVFGALVMVGPALGADLPFGYNNYNYQTPCCNDFNYPPPCCNDSYPQNSCCNYYDGGGRWWGPAVNVHVTVPWEHRDTGWVSRKYVERRYSDESPWPEYRQYRSWSRYSRRDRDDDVDDRDDLGRFGPPPAAAAYDGRGPYPYADGPLPYRYRSTYYHRRDAYLDESVERPPGMIPYGGWSGE